MFGNSGVDRSESFTNIDFAAGTWDFVDSFLVQWVKSVFDRGKDFRDFWRRLEDGFDAMLFEDFPYSAGDLLDIW